jgi:hypothetical protein
MLSSLFGKKKRPAYVQPADPREITTRTQLLNHLVKTYGYERYLEIGVRNPEHNFVHIAVADKQSVDPGSDGATHKVTSDAFFADLDARKDPQRFDLVFVDGLHLGEQVIKDVDNALRYLTPKGAVVLHDCNPLSEAAQVEDYEVGKVWNGTVWKAWAELRGTRPDLFMHLIDIDHGCGVLRPGRPECFAPWPPTELSYAFLDANRRSLMRLVSITEFLDQSPSAFAGT